MPNDFAMELLKGVSDEVAEDSAESVMDCLTSTRIHSITRRRVCCSLTGSTA